LTTRVPLREIDYKAIRFLLKWSEGSEVLRERALRKFDIDRKRGRIFIDPKEPIVYPYMRCEARFTLGDYSDWTGWELRDPFAQSIWMRNPFKVPVWNCEPVGRIYVMGEQGLGDEVLFSQAIFDLKNYAKEIVFETQERLCSVFERSFGIQCVPAIVNADGFRMAQEFEADAWVSTGELVRRFRRSWQNFHRKPYLIPDPSRIAEMERYRGRIGLSWRGAQGTLDWKKLKGLHPDGVSLQYDQDEEDIERPHIDLKNDVEGVIALCSVLGGAVSCSSTQAHFAAAVGCPLDMIIADRGTGIRPNILPWRWMDFSQTKVPRRAWWYPDTVNVYQNFGEYIAYSTRKRGRNERIAGRGQPCLDERVAAA
jgi:hypothetical protein